MSSSTVVLRADVFCLMDVHGSSAYLCPCVPLVKCASYGNDGYSCLDGRITWLRAAQLRHRSGLRHGDVHRRLAGAWACVAPVSSGDIWLAQHSCCRRRLLLLVAVAGCLPSDCRLAAELSVHYDILTTSMLHKHALFDLKL
jgi:hypothetical protein